MDRRRNSKMQPKHGLKHLEKTSGFAKQHSALPNSFIHSFRNKSKPKISETPHFPSLSNALLGNKARASLNASQTTTIYPNPEKQFWLKSSKLKSGKKSLKFFLLACTLIAIIIPLTVFGLGSSSWDTNSSSEFDLGTYFQTDFNASDTNGFVHLLDGNTQGDYNSPIFDSNYTAYWKTLSWEYKDFECPTGMAFIPKLGGFCIDQYEASHSDATFCDNASVWAGTCDATYGSSPIPASQPDRIPWVNIKQTEASTACQAAGKHLCSSAEWMAAANLNGQIYDLSDATTDAACVVDSTNYCSNHSASSGEACNTGSNNTISPSNCKSTEGVYDLIGNVYDWTSDVVDVNTDSPTGWNYPNDDIGYLWGNTIKSEHYGNDGVYTGADKAGRAVIRGGYWAFGGSAGLFFVNLNAVPGLTNRYIGFRCCLKS